MWTRRIGLPTAPSDSARKISGIITPSKKSGAFPITTASTSPQSRSACRRARVAASRTSPGIETSAALERYLVCPDPDHGAGPTSHQPPSPTRAGAAISRPHPPAQEQPSAALTHPRRSSHQPPSMTHTRFCWRQGPDVAWATTRSASPDHTREAASPIRTRPLAMKV